MPTQNDLPIAVGSVNLWGVYGPAATDKIQAVSTNDGDSSLIFGVSGGRLTRQLYTFSPLSGIGDPVSAAQIYVYAKKYANGGGSQKFYIVWDGTRMSGNLWSSLTTSYQILSQPCAGAQLAAAAVNGEHGVDIEAAGGPSNPAEVWVTQLFRTVTFTFASTTGAGDFAYLIGSLVGAMIGPSLLLRDMPRVARAIARVWKGGRNVRLLDHELEPAWRAWRAFRHPAYSR